MHVANGNIDAFSRLPHNTIKQTAIVVMRASVIQDVTRMYYTDIRDFDDKLLDI